MIVVKVELWPGGLESRGRQVAEMKISSLHNLTDPSNYHLTVMEQEKPNWETQDVRTDGAWWLVGKVLKHALADARYMGFPGR